MAEKTNVHGITLTYEANAADGIRYLRDDLDYAEARVFFDQARQRGSAPFEDDADRQFTLTHRNPRAYARGTPVREYRRPLAALIAFAPRTAAAKVLDVYILLRPPTYRRGTPGWHSSAGIRQRMNAREYKNGAYELVRR